MSTRPASAAWTQRAALPAATPITAAKQTIVVAAGAIWAAEITSVIEDADRQPGRGEDDCGVAQQPFHPGPPALGGPTHPAPGALGFGHHDLRPASFQSA